MRTSWHRLPARGTSPAAAGCGDSARRVEHADGPSTVPADRRRKVPLVRTRIVGLAVLTSVLATCLFAIPLAVAVLDYSVQDERGHLVRAASYVAIDVSGEVYDGNPIVHGDLEMDDDDYTVAVYDGDGDRLAGALPGDHHRLLSRALDGEVRSQTEGDLLLAAFPVTHSDDVVGAVLVATPRTTVFWHVGALWAAMAALAAAAVAVAWLVGRRQACRLGPAVGGPGG